MVRDVVQHGGYRRRQHHWACVVDEQRRRSFAWQRAFRNRELRPGRRVGAIAGQLDGRSHLCVVGQHGRPHAGRPGHAVTAEKSSRDTRGVTVRLSSRFFCCAGVVGSGLGKCAQRFKFRANCKRSEAFISSTRTVARPVAVRPTITTSVYTKCSSQFCVRGLNRTVTWPVTGSMPLRFGPLCELQ